MVNDKEMPIAAVQSAWHRVSSVVHQSIRMDGLNPEQTGHVERIDRSAIRDDHHNHHRHNNTNIETDLPMVPGQPRYHSML